jgi:hypothetical protein
MQEKRVVGYIVAEWISTKKFSYTCPYCWSKVNKDGRPSKNAINLTHTHNNADGKTHNQVFNKMSHCPIQEGNIDIHITDKTKRVDKSKIIDLIEDGVEF